MFLAQATPSTYPAAFALCGAARLGKGITPQRHYTMAKLTLTASPTFTAKVAIPVPGAKAVPVEFKFKGRTKDEFKDLMETLSEFDDAEAIMEIASGWDLEDVFSADNVGKLVQNYIGSAKAILETYITQLTAARLGN